MPIIDTIFVRMSHRGKGYTKSLISKLITSPEELLQQDLSYYCMSSEKLLGFSSPISNSMFCLVMRLILANESRTPNDPNNTLLIKERLWIVEDIDEHVRNIWWSAAKIAKERHLDIRNILGFKVK